MIKNLTKVLLFSFFVIAGCEKKELIELEDYNQHSTTLKILTPADTLFYVYAMQDSRFIDENRVVVTNILPSAVYILDFSDSSVSKIGKVGKGPGEYEIPVTLFVDDVSIYVSDDSNVGAYQYDLLGNSMGFFNEPIRGDGFIRYHDSTVFVIPTIFSKGYFLFNQKENGYFVSPKVFKNATNVDTRLKLVELNNKIYFVNYYENKVFELDPISNRENVITLDYINTYHFEPDYDTILEKKEITERLSGKEVLTSIYKSGANLLIVTRIYDQNAGNFLYLIDTNGNLLKKYHQSFGKGLLAVKGNLHLNLNFDPTNDDNPNYFSLERFEE